MNKALLIASIVLLKTATIRSSTTDGSDNSTISSDHEEDDAFQCTSWPKSSNYGCASDAGENWTLLNKTTFGTSECKSLCLQHASGDGCCYVTDTYGCYWKAGSSARKGGYGFAVTCLSKVSDLCKAKDSDACLKAAGTNWSKYTCSSSTKWCTSWAKDMKRCCPESCGVIGTLSEFACKKVGGKGSCIYPNEAQPDETQCDKGSCANTRDNGGGKTCFHRLNNGFTCQDYLRWKDCDRQCNLCACSTASGTGEEHCSGHGTCEATCTQSTCTGAKCHCDSGWSGDKCQDQDGALDEGANCRLGGNILGTCKSGLICKIDQSSPDGAGYCREHIEDGPLDEGANCRLSGNTLGTCKSGLICKIDQSSLDGAGYCRDLKVCEPYLESACKIAGEKLGKTVIPGDFSTKGCYHYEKGTKWHERYEMYYGTGGTYGSKIEDPQKSGQSRPEGFDCKSKCNSDSDCNQIYQSCKNGTCQIPTCPTVNILHTKHDVNGDTGKYFFFSKEEFSNMVGYENWNGQEFEIDQQGSNSWKGKVIVWSDEKLGPYGQKSQGSKDGDWKKSDIIKLLICSQPDLGMCAGNFNYYQDNGKQPPAGKPCVGSCVMTTGKWGMSFCFTDSEKNHLGGECHPCRAMSYITPYSKTSWGKWSEPVMCPNNGFAVGFRLNVQEGRGWRIDDYSLTAIKLICVDSQGFSSHIKSGPSNDNSLFESWGMIEYCGDDNLVLNGAMLRTSGNQFAGDDTAANNLAMKCSDGKELYTNGDSRDWGSWSASYQYCPTGTAICGMATKVEMEDANDKTGLNLARFYCCKLNLNV